MTIINALKSVLTQVAGSIEIGLTQNLFELGLDSLMLVQLQKRIEIQFGVNIPLEAFYQSANTLQKIADIVEVNKAVVIQEASPPPMAPKLAPYSNDDMPKEVTALLSQQLTMLQSVMMQQLATLQENRAPNANVPKNPIQKVTKALSSTNSVAREVPGLFKALSQTNDDPLPTALLTRYTKKTLKSKSYTQKHRAYFANVRAVTGFRPAWKELIYPIAFERAAGARIWDIDGNEYLDITMGFGVSLLGHQPLCIQQAINDELAKGTPIGPLSPLTGEVAELIAELTHHERVALFNTGSEAVMMALRLARLVTQRETVVIFKGAYHGNTDEILATGWVSDGISETFPISPGTPKGAVERIIVLEYGAQESLKIIDELGPQLAAVLVESVQSRNPHIQPRDFLHEVRRITQKNDCALIFDEMITGFRIHLGGAQTYFGVQADLATYGKICGGTLPIGVVAGNRRFMDAIDGGFWQYNDDSTPTAKTAFVAGTFQGHPLTMAAAKATLLYLKNQGTELQENLNRKTAQMCDELNTWFAKNNAPLVLRYFGSLFRFHFHQDLSLLTWCLLDRGILVGEGRNCFLSTAHTDEDIDELKTKIIDSLEELRSWGLWNAPNRQALSEDQRAMAKLVELAPDSSRYHQTIAIKLAIPLDISRLSSAWHKLFALRPELLLGQLTDNDFHLNGEIPRLKEVKAHELMPTLIAPFDKNEWLKLAVARTESNQTLLGLCAHHLAFDGWSMGILLNQLASFYRDEVAVSPPTHESWKQFLVWHAQKKLDTKYWELELAELKPLYLTYKPKSPHAVAQRISRTLPLSPIKQLARENNVSLFALIVTVFQKLFTQLTRTQRFALAIPCAAQVSMNLPDLLGQCSELLPLVLDNRDPASAERLAVNQRRLLALQQRAGQSSILRREGKSPALPVIVNLDSGLTPDFGATIELVPTLPPEFDGVLFCNALEWGGNLYLDWDFYPDQLDKSLVTQWQSAFADSLQGADDALEELPPLPPQDDSTTAELSPHWPTVNALLVDLFNCENIAPLDNFIALGGNSLRAVTLCQRLAHLGLGPMDASTVLASHNLATMCHHLTVINPISGIPRLPESPIFSAATAQKRLWILDQLEGDSAAYNLPLALQINECLDNERLQAALHHLSARHEALRTSLVANELGEPQQQIASHSLVNFLTWETTDKGEFLKQAQSDAAIPFALDQMPLWRIRVVYLPDKTWIYGCLHHAIADGISWIVFLQDLFALYDGRELTPLKLQLRDGLAWQAAEGEKADLSQAIKQLSDIPCLELPTDFPRTLDKKYRGVRLPLNLPIDLIRRRASETGLSIFAWATAATAIFLTRLGQQSSVALGTVISGRTHPDLIDQIGCYADTQVLGIKIKKTSQAIEIVKEVFNELRRVQQNPVPLERLIAKINPPRSGRRQPLFDVVTVMDDRTHTSERIQEMAFDPGSALFDMTFSLTESAERLSGYLEYDADLFNDDTARRWACEWQQILRDLTSNPIQSVEKLGTKRCLHERFAEIAHCYPKKWAWRWKNDALTYWEVDQLANKLAHRLQQLGTQPDQLVAVYLDRCLELPIALLGVLKSGAAYLPIDPVYPIDRRAFMLQDSGVSVVITHSKVRDELPPLWQGHMVEIDRLDFDALSAEPLETSVTPDHLAYCIYTSGSTGQPKGTLVEHCQVDRLFTYTDQWFGFGSTDRWTLFHSVAFDFSVWELWGAWRFGGTLVGVDYETSRDPSSFWQLLIAEQITVLNQTPSAFYGLENAHPLQNHNLKTIIFGGEALDLPKLSPWFTRNRTATQLVNMYGITETTVHVTYRVISPSDTLKRDSVIGTPIPDLRCYLFDNEQEITETGQEGELFIGGGGVTRGYLNRPDLTSSRFIDHPKWGRLYRSGDSACQINGELVYRGRLDQQVKIRGFRIELGEIEAVLQEVTASNAAVCVDESAENPRLVAYLTAQNFDEMALRKTLEGRLPNYEIPNAFFAIESLPLTANGKLDRKSLLAQIPLQTKTLPQTSDVLKSLWETLLRRQINDSDNFFATGGDSILAIQVATRARAMGIPLTPRMIFQHQTLSELKHAIESLHSSVSEEKQLADKIEEMSKLPIHRWFSQLPLQHRSHFNQAVLLKLDDSVNDRKLPDVFRQLVDRHIALRSQFSDDGQICGTATLGTWQDFDIVDADWKTVAPSLHTTLNLRTGQLLRVAYKPRSREILIIIHHLGVDGVSWRILLDELAKLMKGHVLMPAAQFRLPPISHSLTELEVWNQQFTENLPLDREALDLASSASTIVKIFDKSVTSALLEGDVEATLLGALLQALSIWTKRQEFGVHLEHHGREGVDCVGWLTALYPARLKLPTDLESISEAVRNQIDALPKCKQISELANLPTPDLAFNYLGQLQTAFDAFSLCFPAPGPTQSFEDLRPHRLEIDAVVINQVLQVYFTHGAGHFAETIEQLADNMANNVVEMLQKPIYWSVSPTQQGMLFQVLTAPEKGLYHGQMIADVAGDLDIDQFQQSWNAVVNHHPTLRCCFRWKNRELPEALVQHQVTVPWIFLDWCNEPDTDNALNLLLIEDRKNPFDLTVAPLQRIYLIHLGAQQWRLIWSHHHLLLDGWCLGILLRDWFKAYRGETLAVAPNYSSYINWLSTQDHLQAAKFWRHYLADCLPTPLHLGPAQGTGYGQYALSLPIVAIKQQARNQQVTLSTVLQAALTLWLAYHSGNASILFGVTVSGRPAELENVDEIVGLFINTIPKKIVVDATQPLSEWLHQIQHSNSEQSAYEWCALGEILQWNQWDSGDPFDVILIFENYPSPPLMGEGLTFSPLPSREQSHYPLALVAQPTENSLHLEAVYRRDTVSDAGATQFLDELAHLLMNIPPELATVSEWSSQLKRPQTITVKSATEILDEDF